MGKIMQVFKYVYDNFFDEVDWFMKVDDDMYFIMENLCYFFFLQDKMELVYFGYYFKIIVRQGYYSGGVGYIFSKEILRRLVIMG